MKKWSVVLLLFVYFVSGCQNKKQILIDTSYPGGNIIVEKIYGDTVYVKPDLRDTKGEWFYWNFKIRNAANKKIHFQFTRDNVFTSMGPAYSRDHGETWNWYGGESIHDNGFTFEFSETDSMVWFCMAIPYTQSNWTAFIASLPSSAPLAMDTLCTTRAGRKVEKLLISSPDYKPTYRVLITARHHACEMMANYVLEGMLKTILDDPNTRWLRQHTEFMVVPFMDKDGVEAGDQGKNRAPRDHNRDYAGKSLYNSTAALRELTPDWSANKLRMVLDIHCPWIKGEDNEHIYMVGSKDKDIAQQQIAFSTLVEEYNNSELPFYARDFLPFGTSWNTGGNYSAGTSMARWGCTIDGVKLSTSLEFPYAYIHGVPVTVANARTFGIGVAYAMQEYLRNLE